MTRTNNLSRASREIHDGLVQSLAGVNFKLSSARAASQNPQASLATIRESKAQTQTGGFKKRGRSSSIYGRSTTTKWSSSRPHELSQVLKTRYHIKTAFS